MKERDKQIERKMEREKERKKKCWRLLLTRLNPWTKEESLGTQSSLGMSQF